MSEFESQSLAASVRTKFCCSGIHETPRNGFTLFYGKDENASRVDFLLETAAGDQLQNLFRECDSVTRSDASFGSLQPDHFSSNFNLERSGLLQTIRPALLDGYSETRGVEAEICELNVYNEDSHSTNVKDARVGERMFATLIVVFPTRHEGGNMLLRHLEDEYLVDFENMLKDCSTPCIAYAAFFGDVERTFTLIISGHCVMLKYNLYLRDTSTPSGSSSITTWNELAIREMLSKHLSNPSFLPTGGQLGYSLRYHYQVSVSQDDKEVRVSRALPPLRGVDAVFKRVCEEFSLLVAPYIVYDTTYALVLSDKFYPHEFPYYDDKVLIENGHQRLKVWDTPFRDREADLQWVSELRSYGNDHAGYVPGGLCLCVQVGPIEKRATI